MKNQTRYILSRLATRLGVAGWMSSLSRRPQAPGLQGEARSLGATVRASRKEDKAGRLAAGTGSWRGRAGDWLEFTFVEDTAINTMLLREFGSHCRRFSLKRPVRREGKEQWEAFYESDKIERLRFCSFPRETLRRCRFCLEETLGPVTLREITLWLEPEKNRRDFRVSAYLPQKPRELMQQIEQGGPALTGYFDTVNEVMLFGSFRWTKAGVLAFDEGEQGSSREAREIWLASVEKLRSLLGGREVKLIPTCLNPGEDTVQSLRLHMDQLVASLTGFIVENGFDGVDFDWEFPKGRGEWELYGEFLLKIKQGLAPYGKKLSVCFSDWGVKLPKKAIEAIDTMSYMTYDIIDVNGYHSSFGRAAVRALEYAKKLGFEERQINLGLPLYARPTYTGEYWPLWKDAPIHSPWQNYAPHVTMDGINMDGYYNSPGMVSDKAAYALSMGLGGVMLFSLSCDKPSGDPLCLTDAVGRTLRQRIG